MLIKVTWSGRKLFKLLPTICPYLPSFRNIILLDGFPILSATLLPWLWLSTAMLLQWFISRREARELRPVLADSPAAAEQQMLGKPRVANAARSSVTVASSQLFQAEIPRLCWWQCCQDAQTPVLQSPTRHASPLWPARQAGQQWGGEVSVNAWSVPYSSLRKDTSLFQGDVPHMVLAWSWLSGLASISAWSQSRGISTQGYLATPSFYCQETELGLLTGRGRAPLLVRCPLHVVACLPLFEVC